MSIHYLEINEALRLIKHFKSVRIQQIPREQNKGADKLARLAAKTPRKREPKVDGIAARSESAGGKSEL